MVQSEKRARITIEADDYTTLEIWSDRKAQKNGCPPLVKKGSFSQVRNFVLWYDAHCDTERMRKDILTDFEKLKKKYIKGG